MTCQECEQALAMETSGAEIERHLSGCAECRALAEHMRANAAAFSAMAEEELPEVRFAVISRIRQQASARKLLRWGWALAAAAVVVVAVSLWPHERNIAPAPAEVAVAPKAEIPRTAPAVAPPKTARRTLAHRKQAAPPLVVKMLTDDPDVVIYWQVDSQVDTKEGEQP